jgi:DNA-binding protein WhiA
MSASYDSELKREIVSSVEDNGAYLSAIAECAGVFPEEASGAMYITMPLYEIAWDAAGRMRELYRRAELEITFEEPHGNKKNREYTLIIDSRTVDVFLSERSLFKANGALKRKGELKSDKERAGYLQGVFVMRGRLFLPSGGEESGSSLYQLEIIPLNEKQSKFIKEQADKLGILLKESERRESPMLYIKDSEAISDFAARLGGSGTVVNLQSLKVERDARNQANRVNNCFFANVSKTINAAEAQIMAIEKIKKARGLNSLDEKLKELAEVRLDNPEASLNDLVALLSGEVTRSGINHRMRKLMEIASECEK